MKTGMIVAGRTFCSFARCVDCLKDIHREDTRYESERDGDGKFAPLGKGVMLCEDCGPWDHRGIFKRVEPIQRSTSRGEIFYIDERVPPRATI